MNAATTQPRRLLYPVAEAAELLGIHPNGVRRLVKDGKLKAREQVIRGTGTCPRLFIPAAELERYAGVNPRRERRDNHARLRQDIAAELKAAKQYV